MAPVHCTRPACSWGIWLRYRAKAAPPPRHREAPEPASSSRGPRTSLVIARPQAVAIHAGLASAVAVDCRVAALLAMTTVMSRGPRTSLVIARPSPPRFVIARPQAVAIHVGLASAVAVDCRVAALLAMTTVTSRGHTTRFVIAGTSLPPRHREAPEPASSSRGCPPPPRHREAAGRGDPCRLGQRCGRGLPRRCAPRNDGGGWRNDGRGMAQCRGEGLQARFHLFETFAAWQPLR